MQTEPAPNSQWTQQELAGRVKVRIPPHYQGQLLLPTARYTAKGFTKNTFKQIKKNEKKKKKL